MNEIRHIHLGRTAFTVSTEAQADLRRYLEAIRAAVGENADEVVDEIELRMAELLTERGFDEAKVVLPSDVKFLREQLGEPGDFRDEDAAPESAEKSSDAPRRLFRDTDNAMIAGVSAGLGRFFGIDPLIVRLIFVILLLVGGSSVLVYLLLWLLVPEAKTSSDKLAMEGKPVTAANIKAAVEQADVPAVASRVSKRFRGTFGVVASVILIMLGVSVVTMSALGLFGSMMTAAYVALHGVVVAGVRVLPIGNTELLGLIASGVAVVTLLLLLMLAGVAMIRRSWQVPAWTVATLVALLIISTAAAGVIAADRVPTIIDRVQSLHHSRTVQLPAYDKVVLAGDDTDYEFVPDDRTFVVYRYFGELPVERIKADVAEGVLTVDTSSVALTERCRTICFDGNPNLRVELHAPAIDDVTISGKGSEFQSSAAMRQPTMRVAAAKDSYVTLSGNELADVQIDDSQMGKRSVVVAFGNDSTAESSMSFGLQTSVQLTNAGKVSVRTAGACADYSPVVFVSGGVEKLTVNGQPIELKPGEAKTGRSLANCVALEY